METTSANTATANGSTSRNGHFLNTDSTVVVNTTTTSTTTAGSVVPASTSNCCKAPTNVKMTLADARADLEYHGFIILERHEQQELLSASSSSSSNMLVGCLSECHWCSLLKFDILVFCQELATSSDPVLTVGRIQDDLHKLKTDWLLSLPHSFYSPMGCPPQGWSRGRMILMIYLSPQQPIAEQVALHITQKPLDEWCQMAFVAAQDVVGGSNDRDIITSYYYSQETPYWGRDLYPEVRYWAALLTGRRPLPEKPSRNSWIIAIDVFAIVMIFLVIPPNTPFGRIFWCIAAAVLLGPLVVAYAYHARRQRTRRPGHHHGRRNSSTMTRMDVNNHHHLSQTGAAAMSSSATTTMDGDEFSA